jgi:DNA repair protein RecO (recombination protein O)
LETEALVLHRIAYSESDWIVSLFTEASGRVSALTPGARKSKRRYSGGIEPFHGLFVRLSPSARGELQHLHDSEIARPRHGLVASLNAMKAAASVFAWLRKGLTPMLPDASIWGMTQAWLDALDLAPPCSARSADARTAEFGMRLLSALGWELQLQRCVRCDKECPPSRPAYLLLSAGGIVCRSCGGAGLLLDSGLRASLLSVSQEQSLDDESGSKVLRIVEQAFAQHAGI